MSSALAQLFTTGRVSDSFTIKGVEFRLVLLDTRILTQALEAASGARDDVAQSLEYKKQILSRSIAQIDETVYFANEDDPQSKEVQKVYELLGKLHVSIINGLFDKYEQMDTSYTEEVDKDLKNS